MPFKKQQERFNRKKRYIDSIYSSENFAFLNVSDENVIELSKSFDKQQQFFYNVCKICNRGSIFLSVNKEIIVFTVQCLLKQCLLNMWSILCIIQMCMFYLIASNQVLYH